MMSFFTTSSEGREEGEGEQREEIWAKATVPLLTPPPLPCVMDGNATLHASRRRRGRKTQTIVYNAVG